MKNLEYIPHEKYYAMLLHKHIDKLRMLRIA